MYIRTLGRYTIYVALSVWEFFLQENNVLTTFVDFSIITIKKYELLILWYKRINVLNNCSSIVNIDT